MDNIISRKKDEIQRNYEQLSKMNPVSDAYKETLKATVDLEDRLADLEEIKLKQDELKLKQKQAEDDYTVKQEELKLKQKQEEDDYTVKLKEQEQQQKQLEEDRKTHNRDQFWRFVGIATPPVVAAFMGYGLFILERSEMLASTPTRDFWKRALKL